MGTSCPTAHTPRAVTLLQYDVVERLTGAAFRPPEEAGNNDGEGSEEGAALFEGGDGRLMMPARQGFVERGLSAWGNGAEDGQVTTAC